MINNIESLEKKIEYTFTNKDLLIEALTHSSYSNEGKSKKNNERMEFLGDAVLGIVSAKYLYEKFPDLPEGKLSKIRSSLVCTSSLSNFARELELGSYLLLGKGEKNSGGADRDSILENAFEALIAAIYLDGGMVPARKHILRFLARDVEEHQVSFRDFKTTLQEVIQQNKDETLNYVITGESGPDHNKTFEAEVHLNSNVVGKGIGRTKKQAEQEAAKQALQLMGII